MISEKLKEVISHEGVVAIGTQGVDGIHISNTWNSYIRLSEDRRILIPMGGMRQTEKNIEHNDKVIITLGARDVEGLRYMGTGFLIRATASITTEGVDFEMMRNSYPWLRAVLVVTPNEITQTL